MIEQRICTLCKIIKPFSDFNWDNRFNIPFSRCKLCFNAKCKEYRHSKQGKETYNIWVKNNGREVRSNAMKKWRAANPSNRKAHTAVSNALRDGRLIRLSCSICSEPKTEAHHHCYLPENWLNVTWLCKKHHTEITYKSCISK